MLAQDRAEAALDVRFTWNAGPEFREQCRAQSARWNTECAPVGPQVFRAYARSLAAAGPSVS